MKNAFQYPFEKSPMKKGTCPSCQHQGQFRHYENLPRNFGKCERVNHCDYHFKPSPELLNEMGHVSNQYSTVEPLKKQPKIVYPNESQLKCEEYLKTPFHRFCKENLVIPEQHFKRWRIGGEGELTKFIYTNHQGKSLNIVSIMYSESGKRIKEKYPFSLTNNPGEKFSLCLFGEHLLDSTKITCLVESEKTAFIASWFYPEFNWLATGGANKLTDEKIEVLFNREIYYLNDADKAGKKNSTIKKLSEYKQNFIEIDLFPNRNDGYDLADAIIEGLKPEIKPMIAMKVDHAELPKKETPIKNISDFEKVEQFIGDRYELRRNVVANKIECRAKNNLDKITFEELNENNIFRELQKNFINFSLNKLKSLLASDFVSEFDPFKNYFEDLPYWDSQRDPDHILKLTGFLPVKDKERLQKQFKKMLVRSVACSIASVVNKQAFILVHSMQNSGKSTFCRWLCPPELNSYITENITTDKDSLIAMCTNFLINMDELATLNKAEINALKAVMSKDIFKGRLPYAARESILKRRANIVGSTNKTEFLNDETGSVRWLCFELTDKINFEYKTQIDINLIWAQAYSLFKSGFKYELSPEEIAENEIANSEYRIITTEQELIQSVFLPGSKDKLGSKFKTASDIKIMLAYDFPTEKNINISSIGRALKILGFERVSRRDEHKGTPVKGYFVMYIGQNQSFISDPV